MVSQGRPVRSLRTRMSAEKVLAAPPMTLKFGPHRVIAYTGSPFDAAGFQQAFDVAAGILDRLPPYVIEQQGGKG